MISWTYTDTRLLLNKNVYKKENLSSSLSFVSQKNFFFVVCVKILLVTSRLFRRLSDQQSFSWFVSLEEFSIWDFIFERSRITTSDKEVKTYCNVMNRVWMSVIID